MDHSFDQSRVFLPHLLPFLVFTTSSRYRRASFHISLATCIPCGDFNCSQEVPPFVIRERCFPRADNIARRGVEMSSTVKLSNDYLSCKELNLHDALGSAIYLWAKLTTSLRVWSVVFRTTTSCLRGLPPHSLPLSKRTTRIMGRKKDKERKSL